MACWCKDCQLTCPVHILWPWFQKLELGTNPFADINPVQALSTLRCLLQQLEIEEAGQYRTQDLRRGHAKDILENGGSLHEILSAGGWKSPAFLEYLDLGQPEMGTVFEYHLAESSSEDEGDC